MVNLKEHFLDKTAVFVAEMSGAPWETILETFLGTFVAVLPQTAFQCANRSELVGSVRHC
jgi:hypothetical protein